MISGDPGDKLDFRHLKLALGEALSVGKEHYGMTRPGKTAHFDTILELIRVMAEKKPEHVVYLDEGFAGDDLLKANAVQIFKTKGVTSFKTV
ncbi:MAG: hypothetical protein P0120_06405 [Nitrospira sp.]|nr:hypothetical protein [Nitrospira sp.]